MAYVVHSFLDFPQTTSHHRIKRLHRIVPSPKRKKENTSIIEGIVGLSDGGQVPKIPYSIRYSKGFGIDLILSFLKKRKRNKKKRKEKEIEVEKKKKG